MPLFPVRSIVSRSACAALGLACLLLLAAAAGAAGPAGPAKQPGVRTFDSPEAAVAALVESLQRGDRAGLLAILGDHRLVAGQQEADQSDLQTFLDGYTAKHVLDTSRPGRAVLVIGQDDWPFPVPILERGGAWRFDTNDGLREIFNRRIGRNELLTIAALKEYVAAQREYAATDPDRDSVHQFARRLVSTPGKKDGLYWPPADGGEDSPIGALMAGAARDELIALGTRGATAVPFNGYYFKILTRQGGAAKGGAYDYIVGGNMMLGFACVAYPARYNDTGIMTFMVNQDGAVHEKNLGKRTLAAVKAMTAYDPDSTWSASEQ